MKNYRAFFVAASKLRIYFTMVDSIINGLFALVGTVIGGAVTWLVSRDKRRSDKMYKTLMLFSEQIKSYWYLEKLYSNDMASLKSSSEKTIQMQYREKVEKMGYERPTMTANEVKKRIDDI